MGIPRGVTKSNVTKPEPLEPLRFTAHPSVLQFVPLSEFAAAEKRATDAEDRIALVLRIVNDEYYRQFLPAGLGDKIRAACQGGT